MSPHRSLVFGTAALLLVGCTTVVVKKDPGPHDWGVRYYRPKPYLYIGPVAQPQPQQQQAKDSQSQHTPTHQSTDETAKTDPSASSGKASESGTLTDNNFIKVAIELKYLPDYNEEYSIKLRPGIGTGTLGFSLADGWNLTNINMQTDQKLPELIGSIAQLFGAGAGGGTSGGVKRGGGGVGQDQSRSDLNVIVDTRPDVPLGFYEAVIATDPTGRKSLFGWRYVGFMPFTGCPIQPCVETKTVVCGPKDLWGLVATPNSIKFQPLGEIEAGPMKNWPYKYKSVKLPDDAEENSDAPPPGFVAPQNPKNITNTQAAQAYLRRSGLGDLTPASNGEHSNITVGANWGKKPVTIIEFTKTGEMGVQYMVVDADGKVYGPFADKTSPGKEIKVAIDASQPKKKIP
jgi:hypothetical protein